MVLSKSGHPIVTIADPPAGPRSFPTINLSANSVESNCDERVWRCRTVVVAFGHGGRNDGGIGGNGSVGASGG